MSVPPMVMVEDISEATVARLSKYFRALAAFDRDGLRTVSSAQLAEYDRLTPAQVRRDLACFGNFGTRGLGYPVRALHRELRRILGLDRIWRVGLIGVGNVGSALVSYKEFQRQGFIIVALFDADQRKIGKKHKDFEVHDVANFQKVAHELQIELCVLAVPAEFAQGCADMAVLGGCRGILNFAPVNLQVPEGVLVRTENMAIELEALTYHLTSRTPHRLDVADSATPAIASRRRAEKT